MDDYFIKNIPWDRCTQPINAIDFLASETEIEKLLSILEMLGLTPYEDSVEILSNTRDSYLTLVITGMYVDIKLCIERIAPVPEIYVSTLIPALILAHINEPASVKQVYNDFFINKKEEITPLL